MLFRSINLKDQKGIFDEIKKYVIGGSVPSYGGEGVAKKILEKALGKDKAGNILGKVEKKLRNRPFERLAGADPMFLVNILQGEHPQTISLVLSFIEPKKASIVMANFPKPLQLDIVKRIAGMTNSSPDFIQEVERILAKKIDEIGRAHV